MQLSFLTTALHQARAYVGPRDQWRTRIMSPSIMWFQPQISQKLDIQTILTIDVNQFVNKRAFHLL